LIDPSSPRKAVASLLVGASLAGGIVAGCGGAAPSDDLQVASTAAPDAGGSVTAEDRAAGVRFELSGSTLRVMVLAEASNATREIFAGPADFFCGTREEFGPFGASATASREHVQLIDDAVEVVLSKNIQKDVAFCGVESRSRNGAEAFGFFVPIEELYGEPPGR
jgi:hypothetical protein